MCLSGDIRNLSDQQRSRVRSAVDLYKQIVPIIKNGRSQIVGSTNASWRHPQGWQAVVRIAGNEAVVVVHTFERSPREITVDLPAGDWHQVGSLPDRPSEINRHGMTLAGLSDFEGQVIVLRRSSSSGLT